MLLVEFYNANQPAFQETNDDNSKPKYTELRKSRLTLKEINKIRRMHEVQSYERALDLKKIRKQYTPPQNTGGMI